MLDGLHTNDAIFEAFWRFASERQAIYERRVRREVPPWTNDPVLCKYRFTNPYRASDRVSQYLIRHVTEAASAPYDLVFRVALFRFFNKIETWELLLNATGEPCLDTFDPVLAEKVLAAERARGTAIYSSAYIVPPVPGYDGPKHVGHVRLALRMAADDVVTGLQAANDLKDVFGVLRELPGLGNFLAYQLAIDLNYSALIDHDEDDFVVAGPGALDGLSKMFPRARVNEADEIIRELTRQQDRWFDHFGLCFAGLYGRRLHLIDVQNLLCEISKYTRVTHPGIKGSAGRTRIKQVFNARGPIPIPKFPTKWALCVPTAGSAPRGSASEAPSAMIDHATN